MHSLSAAAIDAVTITRGQVKPIGISVAMSNSAGMFQLDQVLKPKLASSGLQQYVEVTASISGEMDRRLLPVYNLSGSRGWQCFTLSSPKIAVRLHPLVVTAAGTACDRRPPLPAVCAHSR